MTKNISITKTFEMRNGTPVTVTGTLILEKKVWLDGDTDTVPTCEIDVTVSVKGHGEQLGSVRKMTAKELATAPAGYTHVVGRLGLTTEQAELIQSVRTELEQHPSWITKQAQIAANDAAELALLKERNSHPGWSRATQSYSYSDEEA